MVLKNSKNVRTFYIFVQFIIIYVLSSIYVSIYLTIFLLPKRAHIFNNTKYPKNPKCQKIPVPPFLESLSPGTIIVVYIVEKFKKTLKTSEKFSNLYLFRDRVAGVARKI